MKHGPGKFYYLDSGQVFEGVWVQDTPKCGTMRDFGRDNAPEPTQYAIPSVSQREEKGGGVLQYPMVEGVTENHATCPTHVLFLLFVGCLTSQQQANVSPGQICLDSCMCCHTEVEVADQTFYLTPAQYTDTAPVSLSAVLVTRGARQGSHWSTNF